MVVVERPVSVSRVEPRLNGQQVRRSLAAGAIHGSLIAGLVLIFLPIAWAVSTSLKNPGDIFLFPPTWIPDPIRWQNYVDAMTKADFGRYFLNTTFITVVDIVAKVMSCSLVAFSFARLRWWGRDVLFMVMLSTLMLPQQVTLIPQFIIYRQLGWIDTFMPLIVPNLFGGPFFTFLLRQFFLSIPTDLDDAARIDGCSSWGVYWRIILPLSRPALMMVAIYVFNITWNDFFGPLIYLHNRNNYTISLGLQAFQTQSGPEWHLIMAASLVAMLPVLVLFFFGQRYFIQGVVFSGVKG
ncbi:MAG TPA: carbohydrate ABC transporter permease [Chloroflexota bacterium]|nr:carbohydrate ABC transporter permease [Chloroflexota bacterium]